MSINTLLADLRDEYLTNRYLFAEGSTMVEVCKLLGATEADLEAIQNVSARLQPDPTLPFRESRNGRFLIEYGAGAVRRLERQPFVLTAEEDFVRHDSGQVREFAEVDDDLQANTAFQALLFFKAFVTHGLAVNGRVGLNYRDADWICTVFNLRTITRPGLLGEPALEGVHSDGVDHTMATLLGSQNMGEDAAVTQLHDMRERSGIRQDEASPELILARAQHRHFLDTLMVVDHERKHSVSSLTPMDADRLATRDMLIFFTRKATEPGHVSHEFDSRAPHATMPMTAAFPRALQVQAGAATDG